VNSACRAVFLPHFGFCSGDTEVGGTGKAKRRSQGTGVLRIR
jgi:hypothetical protein